MSEKNEIIEKLIRERNDLREEVERLREIIQEELGDGYC